MLKDIDMKSGTRISDSRKTVIKESVVQLRYTLNTDDQTGQGRL